MLAVLAAYRPRYAKVAELAGFGAELAATGELEVVERAGTECGRGRSWTSDLCRVKAALSR